MSLAHKTNQKDGQKGMQPFRQTLHAVPFMLYVHGAFSGLFFGRILETFCTDSLS